MGVKERLREYIKTLNISEREFCRQIGVSSSYVNNIWLKFVSHVNRRLIELQKGYQEMIKEKDSQIARLISVIEKLSEK